MTDPAVNVREAFRNVTLALMEWQDPPSFTPREYRRLELLEQGYVYRPYDPQGDVEPYDVQADWNERGI